MIWSKSRELSNEQTSATRYSQEANGSIASNPLAHGAVFQRGKWQFSRLRPTQLQMIPMCPSMMQ